MDGIRSREVHYLRATSMSSSIEIHNRPVKMPVRPKGIRRKLELERRPSTSFSCTHSGQSEKKQSPFMVKYHEACSKVNQNPLKIIKVTRPNDRLHFIADHIKVDDWYPLLTALKSDSSLHYISIKCLQPVSKYLDYVKTEEETREVRSGPFLFTNFLMTCLCKALEKPLTSRALCCLRLERLPLQNELVPLLAEGLSKTITLQHLAFVGCPIGSGLLHITRAIRNRPNIVTLDFTNCNLTSAEMCHIANLIKHQVIERGCEAWKHTLRMRPVIPQLIPGIKRITLNQNPRVGDKGLAQILEIISDDLWLKALDMQNCGITDEGCTLVLQLVHINSSIQVFDVRNNGSNSLRSLEILRAIVTTLARNHENEVLEFPWLEDIQTTPKMSSNSSTLSVKTRSSNLLKSRASLQQKSAARQAPKSKAGKDSPQDKKKMRSSKGIVDGKLKEIFDGKKDKDVETILELVPVNNAIAEKDLNSNEISKADNLERLPTVEEIHQEPRQDYCIEAKKTVIYQQIERIKCHGLGESKFEMEEEEECSNPVEPFKQDVNPLTKLLSSLPSSRGDAPKFGTDEDRGFEEGDCCSFLKHCHLTESIMTMRQNEMKQTPSTLQASSKRIFEYFRSLTVTDNLEKKAQQKYPPRNGLDTEYTPERDLSPKDRDRNLRQYLLNKLTQPGNTLPVESAQRFSDDNQSCNNHSIIIPTSELKWDIKRDFVPSIQS